jgi:hypothetical protein
MKIQVLSCRKEKCASRDMLAFITAKSSGIFLEKDEVKENLDCGEMQGR